ncbi:MAG: RNA-binding protein [Anaerolineaceae bacterium 4572_78]|nr:MAG: RNA-binding protein [Anaerolineaceae bacterium 4572_78]
MNIYVGNISYQLMEDELRAVFEVHGQVISVTIITDRETGQSKGFAFVEMPIESDAEEAIEQLDGTLLMGRNMRVNKARPRRDQTQ